MERMTFLELDVVCLLTFEVLPWGKQIKLQVEIVKGVKVKKTLVEVAKSYDASKLVVGTSDKHFSVGSVGSFSSFPIVCDFGFFPLW